MESTFFIKKLSETVPGFIAGSYALSQLLGTTYRDIDYFVDVVDQDHVRAVRRKVVGVARRTLSNSPITTARLNKYKSRLPDYEFVTYV